MQTIFARKYRKSMLMLENTTAAELRLFRNRLRLTQEELATRLGVSRGRYSNWELGEADLPQSYRLKLEAIGFLQEPTIRESRTVRASETHLALLLGLLYDCSVADDHRKAAKLELEKLLGIGIEPDDN
jgi:transcriptional regulator with XRE-family HTH domain